MNNADPSGMQSVVPVVPEPDPSSDDIDPDDETEPFAPSEPSWVNPFNPGVVGYASDAYLMGEAANNGLDDIIPGEPLNLPPAGDGCPDAPGEDESGPTPVLSKAERVQKFFALMDTLPNASNPNEAFDQMNGAITSVEDDYSGVPEEEDPGKDYTGRMYPPKADSITIEPDGTIIGKTKGNILRAGPDGFITVTKLNGDILWTKDGGG